MSASPGPCPPADQDPGPLLPSQELPLTGGNTILGAAGPSSGLQHGFGEAGGGPGQGAGAGQQNTGFVKCRGLPFSATAEDVKVFFASAGIEVVEVFISKRHGRSTGEAYVQLVDPSQTSHAIEALNRQHMGTRYIELFPATQADMDTARQLTVDRLRGYVVRMRGLPYSASASDVLRFLDGIEVVRGVEGVIFTWTPDGRPTGEAFVELKDEAAQCEAMKRHKELMGTRYIEMFTSTKAALIQAIQHNRLILGFSNRKKWLQQAGMQAQPQLFMSQQGSLYPVVTTQRVGLGDITDGFEGMSIGGQGVRGMGMVRAGPSGLASSGVGATHIGGSTLLQHQDVRAYHSMGVSGAQLPTTGMQRPAGGLPAGSATALHLDPSAQMRGLRPGGPITQQVQVQQTYVGGHGQPQFTGLQQVAGPSLVVQQPYIIQQQPATQYVTMEGGYAGSPALVATGPAQDTYGPGRMRGPSGQPGGQYVVNPTAGGYAVQTIQLPSEQGLQHYLQLGSAGPGELQGSYAAAGSGLPISVDSLANPEGGQPSLMLHQR